MEELKPEPIKTYVEILHEKYQNDIELAIKFDEFNVKQLQMDLPNKRHYWIGRLTNHKIEIKKLREQKKQVSKLLYDKLKKDSPVGLNEKVVNSSIENHELIQKIDNRIYDNEILIDYLLKIEANFRDSSFAIKNYIALVTLETT